MQVYYLFGLCNNSEKTAVVIFWATFGMIWASFISPSGHTDWDLIFCYNKVTQSHIILRKITCIRSCPCVSIFCTLISRKRSLNLIPFNKKEQVKVGKIVTATLQRLQLKLFPLNQVFRIRKVFVKFGLLDFLMLQLTFF